MVVADATPSGPGSVTQMNYATIAAKTRPTMVQALRIATQVAHRHSVVVKHVYCRPAPTGWACDYIR